MDLAAGLFGRTAGRLVHLGLVALLVGLLGLVVVKWLTPLRGPALVLLGGLAAAGGGLLYARAAGVRRWLCRLWPVPIAVAPIFTA